MLSSLSDYIIDLDEWVNVCTYITRVLVVFSDYQSGVSTNMKHLERNFISVFGRHLIWVNVALSINEERFYAYDFRVDGWMDLMHKKA